MSAGLAIQINNKQIFHYANTGEEMLSTSSDEDLFVIGGEEKIYLEQALRCALMTVRLASLIGIDVGQLRPSPHIPYDDSSDSLVFNAPNISSLTGRSCFFLRGWKDFQSCVKGFNALGLIAEQVLRVQAEFATDPIERRRELLISFLTSRKDDAGESRIKLSDIDVDELLGTSHELAAIMCYCFAEKPIVCSTSSNMGIAIHELIDLFRSRPVKLADSSYRVLNRDEGSLVIWAPDRRADFMNEEKAEHLSSLENEEGSTTKVRTYIDRHERDPGAIYDALVGGGYFFPTNPQSKLELKGLLTKALAPFLKDRKTIDSSIVGNLNLLQLLKSLNVSVDSDSRKFVIQRGVEGGIYGLMIPYFILIEDLISTDAPIDRGVEVWNQASIGAALAGATLAADLFSVADKIDQELLSEFFEYFKNTSANLGLASQISHHIVGVFDLANIQSLAQLLGVVVERHLSGKGTPFVGLGSSSYSNGNLCFDILQESASRGGSFGGRDSFTPSTHTLNFVSQALIYGEDFCRVKEIFEQDKQGSSNLAENVHRHIRKPEPAGAASLTGLLLRMLDLEQTSVFEIAYHTQCLGFNCALFLQFCGNPGSKGRDHLTNLASEEGPYMGQFMRDFLSLLEWPPVTLRRFSEKNRVARDSNCTVSSELPEIYVLYLTGDNTEQPTKTFVQDLLVNFDRNNALAESLISQPDKHAGP